MVVATYNVHRCVGADGREDVDRVATVIEELRADVIGLQEVRCDRDDPGRRSQLSQLAAATGYVAVAGPTLRLRGAVYGNAALLRSAPRSVQRIDLSIPGYEPRGALHLALTDPHDGWDFVVTHLGRRGHERRTQVDRLLAQIDDAPDRPLVLLGDFNEWTLRSRGLRRLSRRFGPSRAVRSFPARWPSLALDKIFVQAPGRLRVATAHASHLARQASDHLPVRGVAEVTSVLVAAEYRRFTSLS